MEERKKKKKKKEASAFKANRLFPKGPREIWKAAVYHNININFLK